MTSDTPQATNAPDQPRLPHEIIDHASTLPNRQTKSSRRSLLFFIPLIMALLFTGAVVGMYFQPPALKKFFQLTGLQPGAGTKSPIALPAEIVLPEDVVATLKVTDVVGLARLLPRGDISTVAPPFGSGDARLTKLFVRVGDIVTQQDKVAVLDNLSQLESVILTAKANISVREANLAQTRQSTENSRNEARASLEQAKAAAEVAQSELKRKRSLFERRVVTQSQLDNAISAARQAELAVERAAATLKRYTATDLLQQPDVVVALRNLEAAKIELQRAKRDLEKAFVRTPITGTVLIIHAQPGEKPTAQGIMEIGDTDHMMAEVDVYQNVISQIALGQPVELIAQALNQTLSGSVAEIGLQVGRQTIVSDDTAANIDARVVKVLVTLDEKSSKIASRFTNLEVVARIDTGFGN